MLKKPVFEKRKANCLSELPSDIQESNNTIHSSTKITPEQASKKIKEKVVISKLRDKRGKHKTKKLGQLVRTADIKKSFW